ncbi:MAG: hypothetical protein AB7E09_04325 [Candidatus Izemoplasmatales bacterium]
MGDFKKKVKYYFDQFLLKGTFALVLSLFFTIVLFVTVVGLLVYLISPETSFVEITWIAFLHTLDSGSLSGETGSLTYMISMFIVTLAGIFIMSLFISLILNGFQNRLEHINKGRSFVYEKNHHIILGWNDHIYVIVKKLIQANKNQKHHKIVILSELSPLDMKEKMNDFIDDFYASKVIYRTGSIYSKKDLEMCRICESKNIIVLEEDLNIIKTLVVLDHMGFNETSKAYISVILTDQDNMYVAKQLIPEKLEVLVVNDAITRMISQACLQPGLSIVYNNIIDFEGEEFYFYQHPNMYGKSFSDILFALETSSAIGIFRDQQALLNPDPKDTIREGDQIIVLAADDDTTVYKDDSIEIDRSIILQSNVLRSCKEEHMVIFGVNERTPMIIKELEQYVSHHSTMTIVCQSGIHCQPTSERFTFNIVKESSMSYQVIKNVVSEKTTNIILFYNQDTKASNRDSETLLTLLHIKHIEKELGIRFKITTEIYDVKNTDILDMAKSDDFVVSDMIANKMLTQLAENRYLNGIFKELLSRDGSEIYVKPISHYIKINYEVNMYTLLESALQRNELFIGYKIGDLGSQGIVLNPHKKTMFKFKDNDYMIVIAKE